MKASRERRRPAAISGRRRVEAISMALHFFLQPPVQLGEADGIIAGRCAAAPLFRSGIPMSEGPGSGPTEDGGGAKCVRK